MRVKSLPSAVADLTAMKAVDVSTVSAETNASKAYAGGLGCATNQASVSRGKPVRPIETAMVSDDVVSMLRCALTRVTMMPNVEMDLNVDRMDYAGRLVSAPLPQAVQKMPNAFTVSVGSGVIYTVIAEMVSAWTLPA